MIYFKSVKSSDSKSQNDQLELLENENSLLKGIAMKTMGFIMNQLMHSGDESEKFDITLVNWLHRHFTSLTFLSSEIQDSVNAGTRRLKLKDLDS